jgi:GntR family transcriptional repressor for pyruvate dehydrogenase complex
MLRPIKKTRLAEEAVKQIQTLIKGKRLKPGTKLPSERELMGKFHISRASVREALRILEIMGQIDVKPGSGIYVREMTGDIFLPLTSWLPDHKETLQNHFEARQVLEPRAASFAAQRASNKIIKNMKKTLSDFKEKMEKEDLVGAIMADVEFHRLISQATENKTLMLLMDTIARYLLEGWKATLRVPDRMNKTIGEHGAILSAIEKRDGERASEEMQRHLENALEDLRKSGLE